MDIKWIAEQLDRPGYSQAGLARALGKDAAAVNRMLKGERQIKANELPVILGYLKATPPDDDQIGALEDRAGSVPPRRDQNSATREWLPLLGCP